MLVVPHSPNDNAYHLPLMLRKHLLIFVVEGRILFVKALFSFFELFVVTLIFNDKSSSINVEAVLVALHLVENACKSHVVTYEEVIKWLFHVQLLSNRMLFLTKGALLVEPPSSN